MKRSPEIEAVVRRFLAARAEGDLDEIRDLFSESDDLRLIGTDAHEWHHGPEQVTGTMSAHWEAFSKWDDVVKRLEAFENGGTGWAALEGKRTLAEGEGSPRLHRANRRQSCTRRCGSRRRPDFWCQQPPLKWSTPASSNSEHP